MHIYQISLSGRGHILLVHISVQQLVKLYLYGCDWLHLLEKNENSLRENMIFYKHFLLKIRTFSKYTKRLQLVIHLSQINGFFYAQWIFKNDSHFVTNFKSVSKVFIMMQREQLDLASPEYKYKGVDSPYNTIIERTYIYNKRLRLSYYESTVDIQINQYF